MFYKTILFHLFIFFPFFLQSQCGDRYQDELFSSVTLSTVNYSDVYNDFRHEMDIYTPNNDTVTNRPVIVYMHGGAFTSGSKNSIDCVDFCNYFAKRGYVAISSNYRLSNNPIFFAASRQNQYETVMKSVSDIKAVIRYLRKDYTLGNSLGIDSSSIFVGGYSAGAVLAIHLAYIDDVNDLPTSPINAQNIFNNLGGMEGDAGNYGYSSLVSGVISFAGGINELNWIDSTDEPLFSVHGSNDLVVNYNCGPGLNIPTVFTLCGAAETHPKATSVGVINDFITYNGVGHSWPASGSNNSLFSNALDSAKTFLFPLLSCNNNVGFLETNKNSVSQFPNPANSIVYYNSDEVILSYSVYNAIGKKIKIGYVNNYHFSFNVSDFKEGLYHVELESIEGVCFFNKLIVSH